MGANACPCSSARLSPMGEKREEQGELGRVPAPTTQVLGGRGAGTGGAVIWHLSKWFPRQFLNIALNDTLSDLYYYGIFLRKHLKSEKKGCLY